MNKDYLVGAQQLNHQHLNKNYYRTNEDEIQTVDTTCILQSYTNAGLHSDSYLAQRQLIPRNHLIYSNSQIGHHRSNHELFDPDIYSSIKKQATSQIIQNEEMENEIGDDRLFFSHQKDELPQNLTLQTNSYAINAQNLQQTSQYQNPNNNSYEHVPLSDDQLGDSQVNESINEDLQVEEFEDSQLITQVQLFQQQQLHEEKQSMIKQKRHEIDIKIQTLQERANIIIKKSYIKRSKLETQKQDLIDRKIQAEQRLQSLIRIQESLEEKLQDQLQDFNQVKNTKEGEMTIIIQPKRNQTFQLQQDIEINNAKIQQIEKQIQAIQQEIWNQDQLLLVLNQEIDNLLQQSGEYLQIYHQIQDQKQKIAEHQNKIDKKQLELELNMNINRKFSNNLNFLNDTRIMNVGRGEEQQHHDRRVKIAQIENILGQHGFYDYIVQQHTTKCEMMILENQNRLLESKLIDLQNEKNLTDMMIQSIGEQQMNNLQVVKIFNDIKYKNKLLKMKVKLLDKALAQNQKTLELHKQKLDYEYNANFYQGDHRLFNNFLFLNINPQTMQDEKYYLDLFENYRSLILQFNDPLNVIRLEQQIIQKQKPQIHKTISILEFHYSFLTDSLQKSKGLVKQERFKLQQLQKLLPIVEQKISHVLFSQYIERHHDEIQTVIKTYGKQNFEKKKHQQLEEFHKINCQRLQKDYEMIDILMNKKNDIINNQRMYKIKEQKQLEDKTTNIQAKIIKFQDEKEMHSRDSGNKRYLIEQIKQQVQSAKRHIDDQLKCVLDQEDHKYGIKEIYQKLKEIMQVEEESKDVIEQCERQIDEIDDFEKQCQQKAESQREICQRQLEIMQQLKKEIDINMIKEQLGALNGELSLIEQNIDEVINIDVDKIINSLNENIPLSTIRIPQLPPIQREEDQKQVKSICKHLQQVYEFQNINSKQEFDLFQAIAPLLEGYKISIQKKQYSQNQKYKMVYEDKYFRISNDFTRFEIRSLDDLMFRVDSFFKIQQLKSIKITNQTQITLRKLQLDFQDLTSPSRQSQENISINRRSITRPMTTKNFNNRSNNLASFSDSHSCNGQFSSMTRGGYSTKSLAANYNQQKSVDRQRNQYIPLRNQTEAEISLTSQNQNLQQNGYSQAQSQSNHSQQIWNENYSEESFEFIMILSDKEIIAKTQDYNEFKSLIQTCKKLIEKKKHLMDLIETGEIKQKMRIFKI
ncbi:UNKNOWN [Stylonychia lemnae]|uniref:Uncharacterized protein n=1 Tax=Stylonychia lemnae TaxID=5949 RepID=A0A077ZVP0_STYLE|nr:UNKNOWN [Stylonychia lemnae]|eukprot:CDW73939.1 UNKNOWN [Stylonychia lemnae]